MKRIIDIRVLYEEHGIPTAPDFNKHAREGWVNTHCPFCEGSRDFHLGYNVHEGYFYCWRCGWKPDIEALAGVLGRDRREIRSLIAPNIVRQGTSFDAGSTQTPTRAQAYIPPYLRPIYGKLDAFLKGRNFNPKEIEQNWGVMGMDQTAPLGWRWRIFIPVEFNGKLVSYTTRSITNRPDKYKACPKADEAVHHKSILYGMDKALRQAPAGESGRNGIVGLVGIVVEGVMDAWRIGPGAVALFGAQASPGQRALLRKFSKLFIMLDGDEAGRKGAEKLAWQTSGMGIDVRTIDLPYGTDPCDLTAKDAAEIRALAKLNQNCAL